MPPLAKLTKPLLPLSPRALVSKTRSHTSSPATYSRPSASLSCSHTPAIVRPRRAFSPASTAKPHLYRLLGSLHTFSHTKKPVPQGPINLEGPLIAHLQELKNEMREEIMKVHESEREDLREGFRMVGEEMSSLKEEISAVRRSEGLDNRLQAVETPAPPAASQKRKHALTEQELRRERSEAEWAIRCATAGFGGVVVGVAFGQKRKQKCEQEVEADDGGKSEGEGEEGVSKRMREVAQKRMSKLNYS